jgi:hypothetical protein
VAKGAKDRTLSLLALFTTSLQHCSRPQTVHSGGWFELAISKKILAEKNKRDM